MLVLLCEVESKEMVLESHDGVCFEDAYRLKAPPAALAALDQRA